MVNNSCAKRRQGSKHRPNHRNRFAGLAVQSAASNLNPVHLLLPSANESSPSERKNRLVRPACRRVCHGRLAADPLKIIAPGAERASGACIQRAMFPRGPSEPNALVGKTVDTERSSPRRVRSRYPQADPIKGPRHRGFWRGRSRRADKAPPCGRGSARRILHRRI